MRFSEIFSPVCSEAIGYSSNLSLPNASLHHIVPVLYNRRPGTLQAKRRFPARPRAETAPLMGAEPQERSVKRLGLAQGKLARAVLVQTFPILA